MKFTVKDSTPTVQLELVHSTIKPGRVSLKVSGNPDNGLIVMFEPDGSAKRAKSPAVTARQLGFQMDSRNRVVFDS